MSLLYANDRPGRYPDSFYAARGGRATAPHPALDGDARADVAVVGGGYTGLSAALHLARAGADVALVEAHRIGFGASGRNGGQVGTGQRLDQVTLEAMHGPDAARALWEIGHAAVALVRDLIDGAPSVDWHPGILYVARSAKAAAKEAKYADHMARTYGYDGLEALDRAGLSRRLNSPAYAGGVLDHGAGQIDPLAFARHLGRLAQDARVRLHEGTEVTGIAPGRVETSAGTLHANEIVVATNGYGGGLVPQVAATAFPINNYIVATPPLPEGAVFPERLAAADDRFVVNYWRTTSDNRLIFGGGESYGDRFPSDIGRIVRPALARVFPHLAEVPFTHAWGGTLAITRSRMPYIGSPQPGIWAAAGYSGHGVAMAVMAGKLIAEAIGGRPEGIEAMGLASPAPFPGGAAFRRPLLRAAMAWFALRDRLGL